MAISNETIFITGASSGIGLAMARQFSANGNTVILGGRNGDKLFRLASEIPNALALTFDVTDKKAIPRVAAELTEICAQYSGHLDRVILNAGNCLYFDPEEPDWSLMEEIMSVNFFGAINALEACFPLLKKAPSPHIVAVSSQATKAPFPGNEAYGASKAAMNYFFDSLRMDVARFNMDVTLIQPGFVDTPLTQRNTFNMPFLMTAEQAADTMCGAIERRDFCFAFPRRLNLVLRALQMFPGYWYKRNTGKRSP
ncbi:MAG: SDR family NAD(P)-dependent oxidoreductase [bacterium]